MLTLSLVYNIFEIVFLKLDIVDWFLNGCIQVQKTLVPLMSILSLNIYIVQLNGIMDSSLKFLFIFHDTNYYTPVFERDILLYGIFRSSACL